MAVRSRQPAERPKRAAPLGRTTARPSTPRRSSPAAVARSRRRRPFPNPPHVTLGVGWAVLTFGALLAGPLWVALLMAPVSALAAGSGLRSAGSRGSTASLAAGGAAIITLASALGPLVAVVVVVMVAGGLVVLGQGSARQVLIVLLPAGAGAGLVLTRSLGLSAGLVLAGMVCLHDAGAYLIGTGARTAWIGPIAGVANIAALSLLVAAVLAPPFRGDSPWILGGLAAVLAPAGAFVARRLAGPGARVPALRRLDSLILLGPAWAVAASVLLRP